MRELASGPQGLSCVPFRLCSHAHCPLAAGTRTAQAERPIWRSVPAGTTRRGRKGSSQPSFVRAPSLTWPCSWTVLLLVAYKINRPYRRWAVAPCAVHSGGSFPKRDSFILVLVSGSIVVFRLTLENSESDSPLITQCLAIILAWRLSFEIFKNFKYNFSTTLGKTKIII